MMQQLLKLGWIGVIVAGLWLNTITPARADDGAASYGGVTATVTAIERNWHLPDVVDAPLAGSEFVTIGVRLDNGSNRPAEANMFRFTLVTVDGSLWRPIAKRRPYIISTFMPSGESAIGWLTFEIPASAPLAQLLWRPSLDRTVAIDL
jgi:hypothetical protein